MQGSHRKVRTRLAVKAVRYGELRIYECSERRHIHLRSLVEPYVAVYSRSLVEPSFLDARIGADADEILAAVVQILRNIVCLSRIAALLMAEIKAVDPDLRVAENAVELQPDMLSIVLCRHIEGLPVPAHAGLRILESDGLVTVAVTRFPRKRQVHDPVMRQIDPFPSARIELRRIRPLIVDGSRLGEICEILRTALEIPLMRRSITERELPVPVKVDPFPLILRRRSHRHERTDYA